MRRHLGFVLVAFVAAVSALAADNSTEKILNARHVHDVLRFTINAPDPKKPGVITYTIDARNGGLLHDNDTFVSPGAVDLSYADFNPLKVSISFSQQSAPDPIQAAIDKFAAELGTLVKTIAPEEKPAAGKAASLSSDCAMNAAGLTSAVRTKVYRDTLSKARSSATKPLKGNALRKAESDAAAEADKQARAVFDDVVTVCARCEAVKNSAGDAHAAIVGIPVTKDVVQQWIEDATGRAGVIKVRKDVEDTIDTVSTQKKNSQEAQASAETALQDLSALPDDIRGKEATLRPDYGGLAAKALKTCSTVMETLPQFQASVSALRKQIEQEDAILDSLKQLLAVLKTYEAMRWRNNDRDVVFDIVDTNADNIITEKVTFKLIAYSFNADKSRIDQTANADETRSFDVRLERRLISEYGAAAVYNDLRYPTYSIGDDGTIKKDFDKSNVNAAATLNFLCGSCIGHGVYPGFQFGLSKAKDYPGLLAGGVLRFGGTNRIAVASGVMVTWYKDLNSLHVGDTATDDKLKADLKLRRSPAAWYLAVQYTFQ